MLDPEDPVAMHLLMETAMGDSQKFQVLSFEEVEGIKKELALLATRIDGTKRKLAIETKLRDAASSINRLQSPTSRESIGDTFRSSPGRQRRRTLSRGSHDMLIKTDDELAASVKKCEDLAQELWHQEKRSELLQKQLLEHTAGVLQMTHKGTMDRSVGDRTPNFDSGFSSLRDSSQLFNGQHEFDDRSFYSHLDNILDGHGGLANGTGSKEYEQQTQAILQTEQRLEDLNHRLRDSIAKAGGTPPQGKVQRDTANQTVDTAILDHLDDLEQGFAAIQSERDQVVEMSERTRKDISKELTLVNNGIYNLVRQLAKDTASQYPAPPQASSYDLAAQIDFLDHGLQTIAQDVQHIVDESQPLMTRSAAQQDQVDQYDAVLSGLWDILTGDESAARQRDQPDDRPPPKENFSLQAFSTKIQSLFAQTTGLREQKDILSKQIQQQRALNSQSDSRKDGQIQNLTRELEKTKSILAGQEEEHGRALQSTRQMGKQYEDRYLALESDHLSLRDEHDRIQAAIEERRQESDRETQSLSLQLQSMHGERDSAHSDLAEAQNALKTIAMELEKTKANTKDLEGEIIRLQTEVTVARAELDGAYGTRAQRAAEAAATPALQSQVEELTTENSHMHQRMQTLQQELSETINDYDAMTRSSIEFEREREQLENTIDKLRDRCESVEAELSDEKVRWLGVKSPTSGGGRDSMEKERSTSTGVLKTEFKKMMRETRTENLRALKVEHLSLFCVFITDIILQAEQDERRKLEALVRSLRRDQTPGKSGLSQSMTAS